jgi:hypothetical protein
VRTFARHRSRNPPITAGDPKQASDLYSIGGGFIAAGADIANRAPLKGLVADALAKSDVHDLSALFARGRA